MAPKGHGGKKKLQKLPSGTILAEKGVHQQWMIIEPIGEGGFGVIYSVEKSVQTPNDGTSYVAKVEPLSNGPLFFEKNFFMRHLQPETIAKHKQEKKLTFLGLPQFIGGGTHKVGDIDYRFLIMERFGDSIDTKLKTVGKVNYKLLGTYCSQIIDALRYIHERGYAHMDVKPENLLLKFKSKNESVYLIDFGIADRLTTAVEFTPDKKKMHNGTTLYTSRDSHQGVVTMRGDLEILGYNILQWLRVELPWAKDVKDLEAVHRKKSELFKDIRRVLGDDVPQGIISYFDYINRIKFNETPDYQYVKILFETLDGSKENIPKKRKPTMKVSSDPERPDSKEEEEEVKTKNVVSSRRRNPSLNSKDEVVKTKNAVSSRRRNPSLNSKDEVVKTENAVSTRKRDLSLNSKDEVVKTENIVPSRGRKANSVKNSATQAADEFIVSVEECDVPVLPVVKKTAVKKRITSPPKKILKRITSPTRIPSTRRTRNASK